MRDFLLLRKKFEFAASVENYHKELLSGVRDKLKNKMLYKSVQAVKWQCSNCGFEHLAKAAWDECPSCVAPQGYARQAP